MKNSNKRLIEFKELPQPMQRELTRKEKERLRKFFLKDLRDDLTQNGTSMEEAELMIETFKF
jgi:hypothetical protein